MHASLDAQRQTRKSVPCLVLLLGSLVLPVATRAQQIASEPPPPARVSDNFQSGSVGKVEFLTPTELRLHVAGQTDAAGRNRQATWYYFRLDGVRGRDVTLHLTDLVGEYNFRPGACAMNPDTVPVLSEDNVHWQHFPQMAWDDARKEATLQLHASGDTVWVAHVPPYPLSRLEQLLNELKQKPEVKIEDIGQSVHGRPLNLVTITNPRVAGAGKHGVWLIARQHAWESGTSFVMEGVLRFLVSDDAEAKELRDRVVFHLVPTMDPDGLVEGHVRFNSLGNDVNRHWPEVDLSQPKSRERMPEIWAVKRALFSRLDAGERVDVLLNLHNTETNEYMDTQVEDPRVLALFRAFARALAKSTTFDPSTALAVSKAPSDTTNSLWVERGVPALLLEQRIGTSPKLGRRPVVADRLAFGRGLIIELGHLALEQEAPGQPASPSPDR